MPQLTAQLLQSSNGTAGGRLPSISESPSPPSSPIDVWSRHSGAESWPENHPSLELPPAFLEEHARGTHRAPSPFEAARPVLAEGEVAAGEITCIALRGFYIRMRTAQQQCDQIASTAASNREWAIGRGELLGEQLDELKEEANVIVADAQETA